MPVNKLRALEWWKRVYAKNLSFLLQKYHNNTEVNFDISRNVWKVWHESLVQLGDPCDTEANPKI